MLLHFFSLRHTLISRAINKQQVTIENMEKSMMMEGSLNLSNEFSFYFHDCYYYLTTTVILNLGQELGFYFRDNCY